MNRNTSKMKKKPAKKVAAHVHHDREPEFTVQISDPKGLRKDILEGLREVIIFMQGYEKFKAIQEDKVKAFGELRTDVRELTLLIEKLRRLVPKGNLKAMHRHAEAKQVVVETHQEEISHFGAVAPQPSHNELDELEDQLREIEDQLKGA